MKRLLLFVRSALHATPQQLMWRVLLSVKRRILIGLHTIGLAPLGWYRWPAPPIRTEPIVGGPVIREGAADEKLPLQVNLVGTTCAVRSGMEWTPCDLEKGNRLEKMTLHYMEYLRRLQPQEALLLMGEWAANIRPYTPGYWRDIWNSYTVSIRAVEWIDQLSQPLAAGSADISSSIIQSLAAQVRFLRRNLEMDIGGNHLIKNIRALFRAGAFFQGTEAAEWLHTAAALLRSQIREQILADGMHFELSPSYHLQVMHDLIDIRRVVAWLTLHPQEFGLGTSQDLLRQLDDALQRMAHAGMCLTHPDGMPSLFADGGLHMATPIHLLVDALEAQGVVAKGSVTRPMGAWSLPDAGYFGFSGPEELIVVDCGPVGASHLPAHGHGDCLAIEWTVGGVRVLVDAGVYEYAAGARRAHSRSTAAHNTVTLDDKDQSEFWSSFRVGRRATAKLIQWSGNQEGFYFEGQHDGYRRMAGRPIHKRTIQYRAGSILVIDRVVQGAGQQVRGRILLGPEVRPSAIHNWNNVVQITCEVERQGSPGSMPRAAAEATHIRLTMPAAEVIHGAVWNPDLGTSQPATLVIMDAGIAPCEWSWSVESAHL